MRMKHSFSFLRFKVLLQGHDDLEEGYMKRMHFKNSPWIGFPLLWMYLRFFLKHGGKTKNNSPFGVSCVQNKSYVNK